MEMNSKNQKVHFARSVIEKSRSKEKSNKNGITSLMRAATNKDSQIELVALLNEPNIDSERLELIFKQDAKGRTALDWARISRNYMAVTVLLHAVTTAISNARINSVIDVSTFDKFVANTNEAQSLQLKEALRVRNAELALSILKNNKVHRGEIENMKKVFFPDQKGPVGYTPLMLASGMNMRDVVRELVGLKVPINDTNRFGHTALTLACSAGNSDIVHFLLFSGADVHHRSEEGKTALHYACLYAKANVVKQVLDFLVDRFTMFRLQSHNSVEFDYTRWTTYAAILQSLLDARDDDGNRCEDLLPKALDDKYRIERRLKLSGITGLDRLSQRQHDFSSIVSNNSKLGSEDLSEASDNVHSNNVNHISDVNYLSQQNSGIDDIVDIRYQKAEYTEKAVEEEEVESEEVLDHEANAVEEKYVDENDDITAMSDVSGESSKFSQMNWSHDTENMHVEALVDAYSVKTSLPLEEELNIIRATMDKVRERISLWMSNAEKEMDLVQTQLCPLHCGTICTVENLNTHLRDICPLRIYQCPICHNIIKMKDVKYHSLRECPKRSIACPNAFKGCNVMITPDSEEVHLRSHCQLRMVQCRQLCDVIIPWKDRELHEAEHCKYRMISCDQCKSVITADNYPNHLKNECSLRKVTCRVGCGVKFQWKDLEAHEENVCKGYCKWACGSKIGPPANLQLHETTDCELRPEVCCYDCGTIPELIARNKNVHELYQCFERPVNCEFGCGAKLRASQIRDHILTFSGSCTERQVICPSNLVSWRVLLTKLDVEGIVLRYERRSVQSNGISRESDFIYIRSSKGQNWFDVWNPEFILLYKNIRNNEKFSFADCHMEDLFECGRVIYSELSDHLHSTCSNRKVAISSNMDQRQGNVGQVVPLKDAISTAELRIDYDDFETFLKDKDEYSCEYCGRIVSTHAVQRHQLEECEKYFVFCPLACGKKIQNQQIKDHTENFCPKRSVTCIPCGDQDLWAEEIDEHKNGKCPKRIVPCSFNCDFNNIFACELVQHQSNICPERIVQCSCGMNFKSKLLEDHQLFSCNDRYLDCPQVCGQKVRQRDIDNHIEHFCTNKNHYYQKIIECSLGCGKTMMRRELLQHVSYECPKRIIECPQKCGNTTALDKLSGHLRTCPLREFCCDPGMAMCSRPFHTWFMRPVVVDNQPKSAILVEESDEKELFEKSHQYIKERDEKLSSIEIAPSDELKLPEVTEKTGKKSDKMSTLKGELVDMKMEGQGRNLMNLLKVIAKKVHEIPKEEDEENMKASTAAVYYDGFSLKFRENLQMIPCERHRVTPLMATIRYDAEDLAEFIVRQVKESEDIDMENIYGDTALTLACRLGRLRFVEILVEHGADINKETSNGRTALIEAVKSAQEYVPIIEYLIKEGSIVKYKTVKHGRTALDWARRYATSEAAAIIERANLRGEKVEVTKEKMRILGRPRTVRLLELAAIVQEQSTVLFRKIAIGDNKWVLNVIKDGDFFGPNNEEKSYMQMEEFASKAEESDRSLAGIQDKLFGLSDKVDSALSLHRSLVEEIKSAEAIAHDIHEKERTLDNIINKDFALYEASAMRVKEADIEEIMRYKYPSELLQIAIYASGIIFGILEMPPSDRPITRESILSSQKTWWAAAMLFFSNTRESLRRLQTFSRAKIHLERTKDLLQAAMQLFQSMKESIQFGCDNPPRPSSSSSLAILPQQRPRSEQRLIKSSSVSQIMSKQNGFGGELIASSEAAIDDADWDSDAEGSTTGKWVKGEWVPIVRVKEKWWEKESSSQEKKETEDEDIFHPKARLLHLTEELIQKQKAQTVASLNLPPDIELPDSSPNKTTQPVDSSGKRKSRKQELLVSDSATQNSSVSSVTLADAPNKKKKSRNKKNRRGSVKGDALLAHQSLSVGDELLSFRALLYYSEDEVGYLFVDSIECLLKAIIRFSLNYGNVLQLKHDTLVAAQKLEDLKVRNEEAISDHQTKFELRATLEKEYIGVIKRSRFLNDKVQVFRDKVRVARLLNVVSVNGHTAISWAAAYGNYEIVEELLSRGSSVGYTATLYHLTATYLQQSYKIYRITCVARAQSLAAAKKQVDQFNKTPDASTGKADQMKLAAEVTVLKDARQKHLSSIHYMRSRMRFPVPEAVYTARWEIVDRILERRLLHAQFLNTWIFPSPPPPFNRRMEHHYEHKKISIEETLAYGMNDLAAGIYLPETGWVGPNDPKEPYGDTIVTVEKVLEYLKIAKEKVLAGRLRIRLLANEKRNQIDGEKSMVKAIQNHEFLTCMQLAERRGITIDLETEDGQTCLIAASEEDADAMNHKYMQNTDGRDCLVVEYLLDRKYYRPSVNLETTKGYTALIRASMLGRGHVVVALLDRGADINYQNIFGRTAVHYATANGHSAVTRILVERLADLTIRDKNGDTAYDLAEKENYTHLMQILSQFKGGNLGELQLSRGRVNNQITCPLGCGKVIFPYEKYPHLEVCPVRPAPCPNNCGDHTLLAKEIDSHLEFKCSRRLIQCVECKIMVAAGDKEEHLKSECEHRLIPCVLGCGREYQAFDMKNHVFHCVLRMVECSLLCGEVMQSQNLTFHEENLCPNRRVPCPLKCHALVVAPVLEQHMADVCPMRLVPCEQCGTKLAKQDLETHDKTCENRLLHCPERCGEIVCWAKLSDHYAQACGRKNVDCSLLCGMSIPRKFLRRHMDEECEARLLPCPYFCIDQEKLLKAEVSEEIKRIELDDTAMDYAEEDRRKKMAIVKRITAKMMPHHVKHDCPNRCIPCSMCQEPIQFHQLPAHRESMCSQRMMNCRNSGCLKVLPASERNKHELSQCRFRVISCPQGCVERVPALQMPSHIQRLCTMRFIECPLKCAAKIRARDVDAHLADECIRRFGNTSNSRETYNYSSKPSSSSKSKGHKVPQKSTLTEEEMAEEALVAKLRAKVSLSSELASSLKDSLETVEEPQTLSRLKSRPKTPTKKG